MDNLPLKKILIAEDDFSISLALKTILKNNINCELTVTHNGEEAWKALTKSDYDLILCDWNMPIKTGCELLNDVKQNNDTRHIPFIMLTARADKDSVIEAVKKGVTDYVHKPFDRTALIEKVKKMLYEQKPNEKKPGQATRESAIVKKPRKIIEQIADELRRDNFSLPALSDIANNVNKMMQESEATISDIAGVIMADPTLTARLIGLSNNIMFRGNTRNATLEDAITRIGLKEMMNYLWIFSNAGLFESKNKIFNDILRKIRVHSMATGQSAKTIANLLKFETPKDYYYLGLLHDIGAILVLQIMEKITRNEPETDVTIIGSAIHQLHSKFGAVLMERWGMPLNLQSISLYHEDLTSADNMTTELVLIHFSNKFATFLGYSLFGKKCSLLELLELDSALTLGINEEIIEQTSQIVHNHIKNVSALL